MSMIVSEATRLYIIVGDPIAQVAAQQLMPDFLIAVS
jgi:hypothetical protein